jgi:uncharacterized membrane protein HdeD (DUF308 family)
MSPSGRRWRYCPGVGLISLVWLVGLYALAVGVALIVLVLRVRGLRRHGGREVA